MRSWTCTVSNDNLFGEIFIYRFPLSLIILVDKIMLQNLLILMMMMEVDW